MHIPDHQNQNVMQKDWQIYMSNIKYAYYVTHFVPKSYRSCLYLQQTTFDHNLLPLRGYSSKIIQLAFKNKSRLTCIDFNSRKHLLLPFHTHWKINNLQLSKLARNKATTIMQYHLIVNGSNGKGGIKWNV